MNTKLITENWQLITFIIFCIISSIQIFYYLYFFSRLALYNPKEKKISQTHPVSVVVCARDEAANLANNLPGILIQEYNTSHELIVVNDNSYDDSKYVLEELQRSFKHLNVVELTQEAKMIPGKKFPLAVGIKTAKHEIVLLTDADCIPASEHWIQSMQSGYDEQTEIILGYGPFFKQKGLLNKIIRWEGFMTALQYLSYALAGIPYMGVGRNLSYKKTIFYRHKGFSSHNNIPGGDDDLFINMAANKKNTKINIDKDSFTLTKPASSWRQWIRQKTRHYTTGKYYKKSHKFLLGLFSLTSFLFYPLLITSCIFYNWQYSLIIFIGKFIIQFIIYAKSLIKLNEKDLMPLILIFDLWMFFYYLLFATALVKKPRQAWK
jgi:cellulose synthase/poly-beta-1,6-N-acetylglucosamine synthase-like glycosyltransferase